MYLYYGLDPVWLLSSGNFYLFKHWEIPSQIPSKNDHKSIHDDPVEFLRTYMIVI